MKPTLIFVSVLLALAVPVVAAAQHDGQMGHMTAAAEKDQTDHIFMSYEEARQALLKGSLTDLQRAARHIGLAADSAGQPAIAGRAAALGKATELKTARDAFASLSEEVIKYRQTRCCERPAVAYCQMEKKSWLQPEGVPISNPYLDGGMRTCGQLVKDEGAHEHHHH